MERLGPYRIEKKLAVGGMAEIFLARHHGLEGLERAVILKRILPNLAGDPEFVTMFLDEARLMASLSHPNIAQVFDLGKTGRSYYLVMEYVRGPSLGALLLAAARESQLIPRKDSLAILLQVAQALHYIHGLTDELGRPLGIVHRDLNPANVMVSYDGAVKLIDFGIAKAARKVYETRTGVIKGTYGYIAPEQLSSQTGMPLDHRADVFALGILLYECCTGHHPFDASENPDLLERIIKASYKRPRDIVSDFPPDLDELIARSLSPDPDSRPASVAEMIEGITTHLADHRWVPTLGDVAALAQRLIPDPVGPRPMRPKSSLPPDSENVERRDPTLPTLRPKGRGRSHNAPAVDVDVEETTQLSRLPNPNATREIDLEDLVPVENVADSVAAPILPSLETSYPPPQRPSLAHPPKPRRWLTGIGSILLTIGVGWSAYLLARTIGQEVKADVADTKTVAAAAPENPAELQPRILEVVSEPPGADVFVNEHRLRDPTPVAIEVGPDAMEVWLRVTHDGYLPQQRRVLSTAGQARFVLVPHGRSGPSR